MIRVQCKCGATLNVKDEYAGKKGKCPKCAQVITIPQPEPIEIPLAADADDEMPLATSQPTSAPLTNNPVSSVKSPSRVAPAQPSFAAQSYSAAQSPPEINPFEAPQAPLTLTSAPAQLAPLANLQIVGNDVCGTTPMFFPMNCVKCGNPLTPNDIKTRTIYYAPPWAYLVGGIILMMALRKRCDITYGMCEEHTRKRRNGLWIYGLLSAFSCAGFIGSFVMAGNSRSLEAFFIITGLVLLVVFIGALIGLGLSSQLPAAKGFKNGIFSIKGCKPAFLNLFRQQ